MRLIRDFTTCWLTEYGIPRTSSCFGHRAKKERKKVGNMGVSAGERGKEELI